MSCIQTGANVVRFAVLILIILEVLYESEYISSEMKVAIVLILIILEVLYELQTKMRKERDGKVLILIILEVLYECSSICVE